MVRLMDEGNNPDERKGLLGQTPMHCAVSSNRFEVVKLLHESKCNLDVQRKSDMATPLHIAANKGHLKIVEVMPL